MVIAAHLSRPGPDGQSYLSALLHAQTASDRIVIFVDKKDRQIFRLPSNAVVVEINPSLKNGLLLRFWYRFKLSALLRQYQATVFLSEFPAISPEAGIPQSVFIGDESVLKRPGFKRYYTSSFFNNCIRAEEIFIAGNHLRLLIPPPLHDNMSLLPPVLEEVYKPLSFGEKDLVQKDFAGNRDYFLLYLAPTHNQLLVTVLKGFSRFKKWQKSSFRLLIITTKHNAVVVNDLIAAYRYRDEIHVYSNLSLTARAQLTASAFACIHLTESGINVKELMQCAACDIPQLLQTSDAAREIMQDAAIYFEATEEAVMSGLQAVYRNETMAAAIKKKATFLLTDSGAQLTAFLNPSPPEVKL